MPRRRRSVTPRTEAQSLQAQIDALRRELQSIRQPGPSTIQTDDAEKLLDPIQGQIVVNYPGIHVPVTPDDPVAYVHDGEIYGLNKGADNQRIFAYVRFNPFFGTSFDGEIPDNTWFLIEETTEAGVSDDAASVLTVRDDFLGLQVEQVPNGRGVWLIEALVNWENMAPGLPGYVGVQISTAGQTPSVYAPAALIDADNQRTITAHAVHLLDDIASSQVYYVRVFHNTGGTLFVNDVEVTMVRLMPYADSVTITNPD